jgi:DNA transformation protein
MPARPDPFICHLLELMGPLAARIGPITTRRMFGGHALYYDGLVFALVLGGRCFLKVDDKTRARFEAEGGEPFRYSRAGREIGMLHYLSAPPACLESAAAMTAWGRLSVESTLRLANQTG